MLHNRTILFIHSLYNNLHLLSPNSQFIPTPAPLPFWQPQVCLSLSLFKQHLTSLQSKQFCNWSFKCLLCVRCCVKYTNHSDPQTQSVAPAPGRPTESHWHTNKGYRVFGESWGHTGKSDPLSLMVFFFFFFFKKALEKKPGRWGRRDGQGMVGDS